MKALHLPVLVTSLMLGACAWLPDRPERETPATATPALAHSLAGFDASASAWPQVRWWTAYHDAQLDALVARALKAQPTLAMAQSRVRIADQALALARAGEAANIGVSASISRARLSENGIFPPPLGGMSYTEGDLGVGAAYDVDFWGRNRAAIAASLGERNAARAELADARRLLTRALVGRYQQLQAELASAGLLRTLLDNLKHERRLIVERQKAGLEAGTPVQLIDARIADARQNLKAEALAIAVDRQALGLLLGEGPDAGAAVTQTAFAKPLVSTVPTRLSLELLGRRPDLVAQRYRIEAAVGDIQAAEADYYPNLNLAAFLGLQGIGLGNVLSAGSKNWSLGPALSLPLFDGGARDARLAIRDEQYRLACADYQNQILNAASEVTTALAQIRNLSEQHAEREDVLARNQAVAGQRRAQLKAGLVARSAVLASERELIAQKLNLIALEARQHQAAIALVSALGGGWQPEQPVPENSTK